jgi:hypothetical protein
MGASLLRAGVAASTNSPDVRRFSPGTAGTGGLVVRGDRSSGQLWRCGVLGRFHGGLMPAERRNGVVRCGAGAQLVINGDQAAAVADPDGHAVPPVGEQCGCEHVEGGRCRQWSRKRLCGATRIDNGRRGGRRLTSCRTGSAPAMLQRTAERAHPWEMFTSRTSDSRIGRGTGRGTNSSSIAHRDGSRRWRAVGPGKTLRHVLLTRQERAAR